MVMLRFNIGMTPWRVRSTVSIMNTKDYTGRRVETPHTFRQQPRYWLVPREPRLD